MKCFDFNTEMLWILFTFSELYQMCLEVYLDLMNQKSCLFLCRMDHSHVVQIMAVNCCDTLCHHTSWRTQGYCISLELQVAGEMCYSYTQNKDKSAVLHGDSALSLLPTLS